MPTGTPSGDPKLQAQRQRELHAKAVSDLARLRGELQPLEERVAVIRMTGDEARAAFAKIADHREQIEAAKRARSGAASLIAYYDRRVRAQEPHIIGADA